MEIDSRRPEQPLNERRTKTVKQFILDASIGAKWVFDEEECEKARCFLELFRNKKIKIIVPEFFYSELANICWKKIRRQLISFDEASRALDEIVQFPLVRYSDYELSDVAFENAIQYKISVYDSLYLSLAEIYVAPLVTADETLLKACRGRFDFIESLSEFHLPN